GCSGAWFDVPSSQKRQIVHCVEKLAGIVEERFCDALTRPDDQQRTCNEDPCPARWWVGEWQKCSATCGLSGLTKRTVLCIQSVGLDEQRALQPADCQHLSKPDAIAPCHRDVPCPSQWAVGNWSECSATCGNGTQRRPVYCSNSTGAACDPAERPSSETMCSLPQCQKKLDNANTDWSGSGSSSREIFNEIHYIPSHHIAKFNPVIPNIPESNDVNIITEEDFSAKKGNIFVDDFYYDYNFINFHEDLSYYPFTEKETKGEGHTPELSANDVEGSREMPADVLHTVKPGGGVSEDHLVTSEANASSPVPGEGETEPGGLAVNDLSAVPEDAGAAAPEYAIPDFTEEEEDAMFVPHSEDRPPIQSTTSHDSANSHNPPPLDEPQGAVPTRTSPGQDAPGHGLAPWAPHPADPSPPLPTDTSDSLGEPGSSSEGHASTEGLGTAGSEQHDLASSARIDHGESREMGLAIASDANGAASTSLQQEGWEETPEGTHAVAVANEQAQQSSRGVLLGSTTPGQHSPWAAPGQYTFSDGEHELPQPTPAPAPSWEEEELEEEEALLPPSTTMAATAMPSWEVGNWSECSVTCGVGAIWRTVRCST
ncbi:PREDICTED: A disintegrin and metalloproteinase with thrombospondin motifs 7-like, partial [Buceros rhinoceros silvestris]|uniref:A disintegrin and metalloproteinase with thrombospondin motifs 7-like n=1 Tax=Buceros rhinoceros silvestris TaxID=175836 RepID=UPI000528D989